MEGYTQPKRNVFPLSTPEEEQKVITTAQEIAGPYGFIVELLPSNVMSKGVQGDESTYTRVLILLGPKYEIETLEHVSTQITNAVPVNRVLYEIAKKP